jgi:hypothetical protein
MCNAKQKSLEAKSKKKKFFAERQKSALGKESLCRAQKFSARQRDAFAERQTSALGKEMPLPSA